MAKFAKGRSGNPRGRPKGSKDKRTAMRALFDPHAEDLIKKVVDLALSGDAQALRICIDRVVPPMPADSAPVTIDAHSTGDPTKASESILAAAFGGEISPEVAHKLLSAVRIQAQIAEVGELVQRIEALEARLKAV